MPRTALTVQSTTGPFGGAKVDLSFTAADAANDHEFVNTGRTYVIVKNDDASPKTVTVPRVANKRTTGVTTSESYVTAATSISFLGPFEPDIFNNAGGLVYIDLTADTSLSFAVVEAAKLG